MHCDIAHCMENSEQKRFETLGALIEKVKQYLPRIASWEKKEMKKRVFYFLLKPNIFLKKN